jgi:hypothetical protein
MQSEAARDLGALHEDASARDGGDGRDRAALSGAARVSGDAELRDARTGEPAFSPQPRAGGRSASRGMAADSNSPPAPAGGDRLAGGPKREPRAREARAIDAAATAATASFPERAASTAPAAGFGSTPNLQAVVKELARRQQRLDAHRAEASARAPTPTSESSNPRSRSLRAAEDTHLDIGSIVVQVMPEAPAAPAARSAKPRQEPAPPRRWARSFLDRST